MDPRPNPNSPTDRHEGWDTWLHQQQRYWHEWMEAGQLWLSWWVSTLPPVNWPPAGQVLPPELPRAGAVPPVDTATNTRPAAVTPKAAPARKPRAAAQRHH
ncbi:hypothetical protein ACWA7J_05565 [Leptothrix sp. BB-4]